MCLSHISMVPVSKAEMKKTLFPLSYSSRINSLTFDAVVWVCVSRGNAVAISFLSCDGSGQLPPSLSAGCSLIEKYQYFSSLVSFKMAPKGLLREVGVMDTLQCYVSWKLEMLGPNLSNL